MKTFLQAYKEMSLSHNRSYLLVQWPMVSTVTKGSLPHIWTLPKRLTGLGFKIRPLLLEYAALMLCVLSLLPWECLPVISPHSMVLPFPRGMDPRKEMENLFSFTLVHHGEKQVVQKPVAGATAHTTSMVTCVCSGCRRKTLLPTGLTIHG